MKHHRYPSVDFEGHDQIDALNVKAHAKWVDRQEAARGELAALIGGRVSEQRVQECFEKYPFLLPGIGDLHHGPYQGIVATKFPLGNDFKTDFAFITSNSQMLCFTCVEIESPRKKLFRADGAFHRDYLDSKQQVVDWVLWAQHNMRSALDAWGPMFRRHRLDDYALRFRGILICGRRSDFMSDRKRKQRWAAESSSVPRISSMTYDRVLAENEWLVKRMDNDKIIVCSYRDRRFKAKRVCA